jgi:hypothetical protein
MLDRSIPRAGASTGPAAPALPPGGGSPSAPALYPTNINADALSANLRAVHLRAASPLALPASTHRAALPSSPRSPSATSAPSADRPPRPPPLLNRPLKPDLSLYRDPKIGNQSSQQMGYQLLQARNNDKPSEEIHGMQMAAQRAMDETREQQFMGRGNVKPDQVLNRNVGAHAVAASYAEVNIGNQAAKQMRLAGVNPTSLEELRTATRAALADELGAGVCNQKSASTAVNLAKTLGPDHQVLTIINTQIDHLYTELITAKPSENKPAAQGGVERGQIVVVDAWTLGPAVRAPDSNFAHTRHDQMTSELVSSAATAPQLLATYEAVKSAAQTYAQPVLAEELNKAKNDSKNSPNGFEYPSNYSRLTPVLSDAFISKSAAKSKDPMAGLSKETTRTLKPPKSAPKEMAEIIRKTTDMVRAVGVLRESGAAAQIDANGKTIQHAEVSIAYAAGSADQVIKAANKLIGITTTDQRSISQLIGSCFRPTSALNAD